MVPVDNGITVSGSGGNYTVTIVTAKKQGQAQIQGKIERSPSGGGGGGGTRPERPFDISVLQKWVYIRYSVPSNGTNLIAAVGSTNDLTSIVALGDGSPASGKVNWNAGSLGTFTANDVDLASGSASTKFVASTDAGNGTIAATGQNLKDSGDLSVPNTSTNLSVRLVKVEVTQASIRDGQFQIVLNSSGANLSGTLRLKLKKNSTVVELASLSSQADGTVTIQLDDYIENLASHNAEQYTAAFAAWTVAGQDITSLDKTLDSEVKVLATWKISNYFTPTWGGSWDGTSLTKGMYASGTYPGGLTNVTVKTSFLNSLDPANEGLAVDGSTVIRDHAQDAVAGFERVTFLGGGAGYIENPDRDQQTAGGCPGVPNITSQTIAVTPNNPDLGCGAEAYIPGFKVKTVQDHGSLNGNNKQIDVWIGAGDQSKKNQANNYGEQNHTVLKLIP